MELILLAAFFDALILIIWIVDFIALNNLFKGFAGSSLISIILAGIVTYLLVIPYEWFAILLFFALFAYSFFWGFQPWTWGTDAESKPDAKAKEMSKGGHDSHGGGHDSHGGGHEAHAAHGGGHDSHASHDSHAGHDDHSGHDSHDKHNGHGGHH